MNQLSFCQFLECLSTPTCTNPKPPRRNANPPIENFLVTGLVIIQVWFNYFHGILVYTLPGRLSKEMPPGPSPAGASGARPPHFKSVPPHFTFGPPVATYIQYCIFKMCPSLLVFGHPSGFWPPLLLNPGDGPGCRGSWFIHSCLPFWTWG